MTSSDDVWRRAADRNKQDAFYRALANRDQDRLVPAALSDEAYLHYLKLRDARQPLETPAFSHQEAASPAQPALLSFAEAMAKVERERLGNVEKLKHALFMAIDRSSLHPSEKRSYFQWLCFADTSSLATEFEMMRLFARFDAQPPGLPDPPGQ